MREVRGIYCVEGRRIAIYYKVHRLSLLVFLVRVS
jgi:hypothetical protein